jgi:hypothetical protein
VPLALVLTLAMANVASASGIWTTNAPAPTNRDELGAASAPCPSGTIAFGCIYLEGGSSPIEDPLNTNEIYNTFTNIWSTGSPMPTARNRLGVAAARCALGQTGTCIYAMDGLNGKPVSTNEAYRPPTNTWTTLTADPVARYGVGAAAAPCPGGSIANGCVYVVDGYNGTALSTNEAYNTFTNTWSTLAPDPVARVGVLVAAGRCPVGQTGTCIYAFGGGAGGFLTTAESYNPRTNGWTTLPMMPTYRDRGGAAAAPCPGGTIAAGCIYAVDGLGGTGPLNRVEAYNTFTNTWFTETPDPISRQELAVVAARCSVGQSGICVYALDGESGSGVINTNESLKP